MTTPTIGELVAKHNELLAFIEGENAAFEQKMKPYNDGIFAIKAACLATLQAQGQKNAKTEDGTAYQSTTLSVKVDNRDALLKFVLKDVLAELNLENYERDAEHYLAAILNSNAWAWLDIGVLKEPVKQWLEDENNNGTPPPGVKTEFFTKCNIRRT